MRSRLGAITAGIAAGLVGLATVLSPLAAHATTAPPWEPDPNAVGTITFYNSSGHQIIGGLISDLPFSVYAVGSALPRAGDTKALLQYAQPDPTLSDPASWHTATISTQATAFPVTGAGVPSSISSLDASHPVVTEAPNDNTIEQDIFAFPNTGPSGDSFDGASGCAYETLANDPSTCTNTAYQNLYQMRLLTSNGSSNTSVYDDADLLVDPTTGAWSQVYPAPPPPSVTTTTSVTADPATSTTQGTSVTLTATIVASDSSSPPGTVQFMDGTTAVGSPIEVDTGSETAEYDSSNFSPGQHSFTAVFAATDPVTYGGSTSDPEPFLVNPVATKPTISGKTQVGKTVSCKEATSLGETSSVVWNLNAKAVSNARTFTLPGSARGKSLTCIATVTVPGGTPSSATSAAKKVALGASLRARRKPTLSGAATVGRTEKVNHGTWSPRASSYTYQWRLNGKPIKHATKSSYRLVKADNGKKISCKVRARKSGYAAGKAITKPIKVKI